MDGTYGITMGPDGVDIDWPKTLTSDDALVAFIQDLRKFGIATSSKIDNTTGEMVVITPGAKGIYQRGLYIEPADMTEVAKQFSMTGNVYLQVPEPKSAWIFQREIKMTPSHYGVLYQNQLYDTPYGDEPKTYEDLSEELARHIPDIYKRVRLPCSCGKVKTSHARIWNVIQHLNDDHHPKKKINGLRRKDIWTRERIADWLDEVDADLAFDPDLPAKRTARREAAVSAMWAQQKALTESGAISTTAALKGMQEEVQGLKSSIVKINVAIDEFKMAWLDEIQVWNPDASDAPPGCKCMMCTQKNNQEES